MKKLFFSIMALGAILLTGCQEEIGPVMQGGNVTFTLQTPDVATKTIGDGENVDIVYYEIYLNKADHKNNLNGKPLVDGTVPMDGKAATLSLNLLEDQEYVALFWAQVDKDAEGNENAYYDVSDLRGVKVNYPEVDGVKTVAANDESRAAFYKKYEFNTENPQEYKVTLVRPFAQLNLGTTQESLTIDYDKVLEESQVAVSGVATVFNVAEEKALKASEDVLYAYATVPAEHLKVNDVEYAYAGMNYFLVPEDEGTVNIVYDIKTDVGTVNRAVSSVPVKKNYRTNLLGNLLTKETKIEIVVDERFVADYNGDTEGNFLPAYNEETKTWQITDAEELQWVSEHTAAGNSFKGQTVMVMNDIDLQGAEWTPISGFSGTFTGAELTTKADAAYPTISNFKVNVAKAGGLFGSVTNGILKNINITGAEIRSNHYAGVLVGYMHGVGSVNNVHVSDSKVTVVPVLNDKGKYDDGDKAGSIAGYFCEDGSGTMIMEGCSATNVEILAYRDLGGLVGCLNGDSASIDKYTVTGVTVTADTDYDYKDDSAINAGKVVGRLEGGATLGESAENTVENVTVTVIQKLSELVSVEGAVIKLLPNRAYNLPKTIADGVTIEGAEGTVMNVAGTSVTADNFTLKNVTVQNNGKERSAISLSGLNPTLENCVFKGAAGNGYGVVVSSSVAENTITLKNCDFSQDDFFKPVFDGWNGLAGATLLMDGCKLANGLYTMHIDASGKSGKIIVKNSDVYGFTTNGASLESVTFENCVFGAAAGYACVNVYTSHSFINCTFPTKESVNNIGNYGLYVASKAKGDKLVINNCKMSDGTPLTLANIAVADGGFLHWDDDTAAMDVTVNEQPVMTVIPEKGIVVEGTTYVKLAKTWTSTVNVSGEGTLVLDDVTIVTESGDGIDLADDSKVTLTGRALSVEAKAGSAISGKAITIKDFAGVTAKGNGNHAFGIGGNDATVVIDNSTIDYVCGGHVQPLFVNDTKYGKSEPEGAPAIGGAKIIIRNNSVVTKADGGSKAAAIGAQYWQSTDIEILNSTILEANGGNASAGIGGSRYEGEITADNKQVSKIYIENSTVTATGGEAGAGIGSGYDTHCAANDVNAVNDITIVNSTIIAQGGKYAAGIGTGYHAAALTGSIDAASKITATSGEKFYKDAYSTAQNIGYGVVDPTREFKGAEVTFTVAGEKIAFPFSHLSDTDGNATIYSTAGMQWFANEVNVNKNSFAGKTVKLAADVDLEGIDWEPIGQTGATTFNGVFDGQNHTISNLNVNSEDQTGAHYSSGLFGWVESHSADHGHIKNVKISGATVTGHHNCGALVGYITQETALVENCHVTGATISCTYANGDADGDKAGALIGNATVATPVKDCTAAKSTVSAGRDAGQVIGAGKEANVTGCSATEVTVTANGTGTGGNVRNEVIGRLL